MTDDLIARADEILKHSGVKGMKWGQRRSHFEEQQQAKSDKKMAKADKKWDKESNRHKALTKINDEAFKSGQKELIGINKRFADKDLSPGSKDRLKYDYEYMTTYNKHLAKQASIHGQSPSGKKEFRAVRVGPNVLMIKSFPVKHAAEDPESFNVRIIRDDKGLIIGFGEIEIPDDPSLMQTDNSDKGLEFIDHSGVKGMRWGVRRSRKEPKTGHVIKIGERKPSGTPQPGVDRTTGVRTHPGKMKPGARKYDVKDLSNDDLKRIVARMKLESDYAALNDKNKGMGKKFVDDLIAQAPKLILAGIEAKGKQTVKEQLNFDSGKKGKKNKNKNKGP